MIYQDLAALKDAVSSVNRELKLFESSCFDGEYITGDITAATWTPSSARGWT